MDLEITGQGLMQRVGAEPRKPPNTTPWFDDTRTSHSHHAAYLSRLTKLRQELIKHEHTRLVNALERFSLQNSEGNSLSSSPKVPNRGLFRKHAHNALPLRTLTSTAEKFRKIKRTRSPPRLEALQGKQLLEPPNKERYSSELSSREERQMGRRTIDATFSENLKRILNPKPSRSIPTVGRRTFQQSCENSNDTSQNSPRSLSIRRSQTHHKFAVSTMMRKSRQHLVRPDTDELDLCPQTIKFERFNRQTTQVKRTDERDNNSYNVFYIPSTSEPSSSSVNSSRHGNGNNSNGKDLILTQRNQHTSVAFKNCGQHINVNFDQSIETCPACSALNKGESLRRRIVIDMPDIILNPATPLPDLERHSSFRNGNLVKACKQNELRQREISNLLDDVKELNTRTDTLENKLSF